MTRMRSRTVRANAGAAAALTALLLAAPSSAQDHGDHAAPPADQQDHGDHAVPPVDGHDHAAPRTGPRAELPPGIPPLTDEDRAAAFPELDGQHTVHDHAVHTFVLVDEFEWQRAGGANSVQWKANGWIGGDLNRFRFRAEGHAEHGRLGDAEAHLLYGRAIAPWWEVVAGIRQDVRPGPAQTWAAIGLQGLAPYWFEVAATAYVGAAGRTQLRLEAEYDLLVTNRLILQPGAQLDFYGKSDPERGRGAGLSTAEAGLRLRYEIRREFAPYVGVEWSRKLFGTADLADAAGAPTGSVRVAAGLRLWF